MSSVVSTLIYVHGHRVMVYMDHSVVNAILETPNLACPLVGKGLWPGSGEIRIVYHPGKKNKCADVLSRCPHSPRPTCIVTKGETQVASISTSMISEPLEEDPFPNVELDSLGAKQQKDTWICDMFLQEMKLPSNDIQARTFKQERYQLRVFTLT